MVKVVRALGTEKSMHGLADRRTDKDCAATPWIKLATLLFPNSPQGPPLPVEGFSQSTSDLEENLENLLGKLRGVQMNKICRDMVVPRSPTSLRATHTVFKRNSTWQV